TAVSATFMTLFGPSGTTSGAGDATVSAVPSTTLAFAAASRCASISLMISIERSICSVVIALIPPECSNAQRCLPGDRLGHPGPRRGRRVGGLLPCPCLCACPCPSACRWPRPSASKSDREARDRRANVRSRRVVERGWLKWRRKSRWTTSMRWTAGACSSADSRSQALPRRPSQQLPRAIPALFHHNHSSHQRIAPTEEHWGCGKNFGNPVPLGERAEITVEQVLRELAKIGFSNRPQKALVGCADEPRDCVYIS